MAAVSDDCWAILTCVASIYVGNFALSAQSLTSTWGLQGIMSTYSIWNYFFVGQPKVVLSVRRPPLH